jgi:surfactin synthase thioesterase subunit
LISDGLSSTTSTIAKAVNGTAYNVTWGNVLFLPNKITSDIQRNYTPGQVVRIYGYSLGGNIALQVSRALDGLKIPVSILFTVDAPLVAVGQ